MRSIKTKFFVFLLLSLLFSCSNEVFFYAQGNSTLFSDAQVDIATGKNQPFRGVGYGSVFFQNGRIGSYPAMYLSNDDPVAGENIVILSFDSVFYSSSKQIELELFFHSIEKSLKNLELLFIPIVKPFDIQTLTYSRYSNDKSLSLRKRTLHYFFQVDAILLPEKIKRIPATTGAFINVDISAWKDLFDNDSFYGIAIEVQNYSRLNYQTADSNNVITGSGIIEIASVQWESWSGVVDDSFYSRGHEWELIENRAFHSREYTPKIIMSD